MSKWTATEPVFYHHPVLRVGNGYILRCSLSSDPAYTSGSVLVHQHKNFSSCARCGKLAAWGEELTFPVLDETDTEAIKSALLLLESAKPDYTSPDESSYLEEEIGRLIEIINPRSPSRMSHREDPD